jgi:ERCC4-type nuclease
MESQPQSSALLVIGVDETHLKEAFETNAFAKPHPTVARKLEIGDAMITSSANETAALGHERTYWLIERKLLHKGKGQFEQSDLIASLKDGRMLNQTARMKALRATQGCRLLIILEGPMAAFKNEEDWVCGLKVSTIRDKILEYQVLHHIYIYNTLSLVDTALFLQRMAWKVHEHKFGIYEPPLLEDAHKYMSVKKSDALTPLNGFRLALESGVKGLGRTRAKTIADHYKTPVALTRAYLACGSEYERTQVACDLKDIGKKTAKALYLFWYGEEDGTSVPTRKPQVKKKRRVEATASSDAGAGRESVPEVLTVVQNHGGEFSDEDDEFILH